MMRLAKKKTTPPEIVDLLQQAYPGATIAFAGDGPSDDLPDPVLKAIAGLRKVHKDSLVHGRCAHCERKYPRKWPPEKKLLKGWGFLRSIGNKDGPPEALLCPDC